MPCYLVPITDASSSVTPHCNPNLVLELPLAFYCSVSNASHCTVATSHSGSPLCFRTHILYPYPEWQALDPHNPKILQKNRSWWHREDPHFPFVWYVLSPFQVLCVLCSSSSALCQADSFSVHFEIYQVYGLNHLLLNSKYMTEFRRLTRLQYEDY